MGSEQIVVLTGSHEGQEFKIIDENTCIGRHPSNQIVLDEQQISRNHARIEHSGKGVVLRDLGSGNGTYIDGRKIIEHILEDGEIFRVGPIEMRFDDGPHPSRKVRVKLSDGSGIRIADETDSAIRVAAHQEVDRGFPTSEQGMIDPPQLGDARERLTALFKANQIISSETDLELLFERVMEQVFSLVPASNGVIMLNDSDEGELVPVYERNDSGDAQITISSTIVHRACEEGEAVLVHDAAEDSRFQGSDSIFQANIASAICVPLIQHNETLGVLYVDTRGNPAAFGEDDLELLVALAAPTAIAIKNARYVEELESDFESTLRLLANTIELRDHYTVGHTWRVTNYSVVIARELGWSPEQLKTVERGGLLHDVGKIAVPDAVLRKTGKLNDEEMAQMRIHPEKGAALLQDHRKLRELVPYCLYHHERYDGKGYPFGLKADKIPIEGRIVAVADTFDAITTNRPYHAKRDYAQAIQIIIENRGTQFDPHIADTFVKAYQDGKLDHVLELHDKNDEKSLSCAFCSTHFRMPDEAEEDDVIGCPVCHRELKLTLENDTLMGVLLTENAHTVDDVQPEEALQEGA